MYSVHWLIITIHTEYRTWRLQYPSLFILKTHILVPYAQIPSQILTSWKHGHDQNFYGAFVQIFSKCCKILHTKSNPKYEHRSKHVLIGQQYPWPVDKEF